MNARGWFAMVRKTAAGWMEDGRKVDDFQGAEVVELRYSKRL